jgi:hypothetical protein
MPLVFSSLAFSLRWNRWVAWLKVKTPRQPRASIKASRIEVTLRNEMLSQENIIQCLMLILCWWSICWSLRTYNVSNLTPRCCRFWRRCNCFLYSKLRNPRISLLSNRFHWKMPRHENMAFPSTYQSILLNCWLCIASNPSVRPNKRTFSITQDNAYSLRLSKTSMPLVA